MSSIQFVTIAGKPVTVPVRDLRAGDVFTTQKGERLQVAGVQVLGAVSIVDFTDGTATPPVLTLSLVPVLRADPDAADNAREAAEVRRGVMHLTEHEANEWRRLSVAAYGQQRNRTGHSFGVMVALHGGGEPMRLDQFDRMQAIYRRWLIAGFDSSDT